MAHCIDSMWAPRADPINAALAAEGIRALASGLPLIVDDPAGTGGREQALYGAYLSAVAFASAGSGLHHKICHVLGGTFNLPHAQTHATVLPYVLAFNTPLAPDAAARIAAAFGTGGSGAAGGSRAADALAGLQELRTRLAAPQALKDYGFTADGIAEAVAVIMPAVPASNPREVTEENLTRLLTAALTGEDPRVLLDL
jgi:maleylacetate reductase